MKPFFTALCLYLYFAFDCLGTGIKIHIVSYLPFFGIAILLSLSLSLSLFLERISFTFLDGSLLVCFIFLRILLGREKGNKRE